MPKQTRFRTVRQELGLSQEAAGRLLGVTLQTAYRWDSGKFKTPEEMLGLLPILAGGQLPKPCKEAEAKGLNVPFLADHIRGCDACQRVLAYIRLKTGKL
jgi:transcriptional regulator with XRE-family HTH domain